VLPWTAAVLVPPGWDMRYTEVFGFKLEDIAMEGAESLETKMRSAGMPMDQLPGPPIFAYNLPAERRVENGLRLVRGGVLGEKLGPPSSDPETVAALFDLLGASIDSTKAPPEPGTIQWDFPDAEPWHLVVANGDTRMEPGRAEDPTVTFHVRFEDWADVFAGREHPLRLAARRRLKPSGDFRWLWRARRMFPK
jgi:Alkyl sulfatase C-terminal